jgi:thiosulfate reductase cytochrome b subunit
MGFNVVIDYSHVSKYMDSLTIRGYGDEIVFHVNFAENHKQVKKRINTLRKLFYVVTFTI